MFTRAGYNLRGACRWGFWARVWVRGRGFGWAQIVEFASGDLAWYSSQRQFLVWGHVIELHRYVHSPCSYRDAPRCGLTSRQEIKSCFDPE